MGKTNRIGGTGMIAQWLTGETRQVIRHRRGVAWCPFCDRSRMDAGPGMICDGCNAVFKDGPEEPVQVLPSRRRRRATNGDTEESPEQPADPDPE